MIVDENSAVVPVAMDEGPRRLVARGMKYDHIHHSINTADSPDTQTLSTQREVGREDDAEAAADISRVAQRDVYILLFLALFLLLLLVNTLLILFS